MNRVPPWPALGCPRLPSAPAPSPAPWSPPGGGPDGAPCAAGQDTQFHVGAAEAFGAVSFDGAWLTCPTATSSINVVDQALHQAAGEQEGAGQESEDHRLAAAAGTTGSRMRMEGTLLLLLPDH